MQIFSALTVKFDLFLKVTEGPTNGHEFGSAQRVPDTFDTVAAAQNLSRRPDAKPITLVRKINTSMTCIYICVHFCNDPIDVDLLAVNLTILAADRRK